MAERGADSNEAASTLGVDAGYFRDGRVMGFLRDTLIPEILLAKAVHGIVRVWVAGCGTGEDAYFLAVLFLGLIQSMGLRLQLQIFASDANEEAVAVARDGHYSPEAVKFFSPDLLEQYFLKGETGYTVTAQLRGVMAFTVHNALNDPPFSRVDLISCHNLWGSLDKKAQARVLSLFGFALRENGLLVIGKSETSGEIDDRLELISRSAGVYRRIGQSSLNEEYSLTSEALVTANEELRSRDAELRALNNRLHEALEHQRALSNDLQNVLYGTDVATLVLDTGLRIRFFTPAVRSLFNVIPANVGRPLSDLAHGDTSLETDVVASLVEGNTIDREIQGPDDRNYVRSVKPRRNGSGTIDGVVITFSDISASKRVDETREAEKKAAERASGAKPLILSDASEGQERLREPETVERATGRQIEVIDDEQDIRDNVRVLFEDEGWTVGTHVSAEAYLAGYEPDRPACLLIDAHLPGMDGIELLRLLRERQHRFPVIVITGHSDLRMAIDAVRYGAADFIEKPFSSHQIFESVQSALDRSRHAIEREERRETARATLAMLTRKQRQVLDRIVQGQANKVIAADLKLSQRTVENHRASIMRRTKSASLPALLRLVLNAEE